MQQELGGIQATEWVRHANTQAYEKNWSCVPLRSVGGRLDHILSINDDNFQDTTIRQRCPYLAQVIDRFECEKSSVRLMSLASAPLCGGVAWGKAVFSNHFFMTHWQPSL